MAVAQADAGTLFVLRTDPGGAVTATETPLVGVYGRLAATTLGRTA